MTHRHMMATRQARAWRLALVVALCAVPGWCAAQAGWPERQVQLIVPFPAGGAVDVVARAFAERFGEFTGRPVVIVNRDGASGTIGVA